MYKGDVEGEKLLVVLGWAVWYTSGETESSSAGGSCQLWWGGAHHFRGGGGLNSLMTFKTSIVAKQCDHNKHHHPSHIQILSRRLLNRDLS